MVSDLRREYKKTRSGKNVASFNRFPDYQQHSPGEERILKSYRVLEKGKERIKEKVFSRKSDCCPPSHHQTDKLAS